MQLITKNMLSTMSHTEITQAVEDCRLANDITQSDVNKAFLDALNRESDAQKRDMIEKGLFY